MSLEETCHVVQVIFCGVCHPEWPSRFSASPPRKRTGCGSTRPCSPRFSKLCSQPPGLRTRARLPWTRSSRRSSSRFVDSLQVRRIVSRFANSWQTSNCWKRPFRRIAEHPEQLYSVTKIVGGHSLSRVRASKETQEATSGGSSTQDRRSSSTPSRRARRALKSRASLRPSAPSASRPRATRRSRPPDRLPQPATVPLNSQQIEEV